MVEIPGQASEARALRRCWPQSGFQGLRWRGVVAQILSSLRECRFAIDPEPAFSSLLT
jgi:hypothetical protein